jgi:hypothetical protein
VYSTVYFDENAEVKNTIYRLDTQNVTITPLPVGVKVEEMKIYHQSAQPSAERQEPLVLREHLSSSPVLMGSVLFIFLVFCAVCFALFVFVLCLVYSMLSFALDYPFLVATSVYSNVYLYILINSSSY